MYWGREGSGGCWKRVKIKEIEIGNIECLYMSVNRACRGGCFFLPGNSTNDSCSMTVLPRHKSKSPGRSKADRVLGPSCVWVTHHLSNGVCLWSACVCVCVGCCQVTEIKYIQVHGHQNQKGTLLLQSCSVLFRHHHSDPISLPK